MRKFSLTVLIIVSILAPVAVSAGVEGFARISLVQGEAQVRNEDSGEWLPAGVNTPLEEGDSVWAPAGSRVEIQLRNGSYLRLEERTIIDLVDIEIDQQRVHVSSGRLYVKTGSRADDLQVDWGDASVLVERKTRLKVDLLANGDEDVAILKGAASVQSAGERTRVRAGETMTLHDYRGADISPLQTVDEWEKWNKKRDKQLATRKGSEGYLPAELVVYEDELAGNGEWVVAEEYGYVWRPRVSVNPDWAPYREGRWVWRGNDYIWITSEPWGWATYHYGRWAVVAGHGWCWVPPSRGDVFWGPGYVAWVNNDTQVGWVPLAPRETYYGRRNYGRYSEIINRDARVVNNINVSYRNVTVHNAITVVQRDGFARGTGRHEPARENIFRNSNALIQRPEIRPAGREARMPVVKPIVSQYTVPAAQRPPVKELRERYPLLREERRRDLTTTSMPKKVTPLPANRETRPDQRGNVTVPPAPAKLPSASTTPPPPVPRRGSITENSRDHQAEVTPKKVPSPPPQTQRLEVVAPHSTQVPEPKPQESRVITPSVAPPQEKGKGAEVRGEPEQAKVQQRGARRAWRVETKEQSQKQKVQESVKKEPKQEQRQEKRRRDD